MNLLRLPPESWSSFFDGVNAVMRGKLVEIEVVGLNLGDQIEAEWVPLNGITYEPKKHTLHVYAGWAEGGLDHAIQEPKEIAVELGEEGVNQVSVIDAEGEEQFIHLRSPLALPALKLGPAP